MKRGGVADLPLHYGRVPRWLADRMARLGGAMVQAIVEEEGNGGFLSRLSDPHWFQAFGAVLGMDWHSSGITTSVMGALKKGLQPRSKELGLAVCGGRGRYSRGAPGEILDWSDQRGLDGEALVRASRLSAKVDNTCLQDGFSVYLHSFVVAADGRWAVIQQGMNTESRLARRYHWHSDMVRSFVDDPRSAVVGDNRGRLVNLSDTRSADARDAIMDFSRTDPTRQWGELKRILVMPAHHDVRPADVDPARLGSVLALAWESHPMGFEDLVLLSGVGPRTLQSLALVSEVIYGEATRFDDPARFSFAHGGKDGHPFPVPLDIYDKVITTLENAVHRAGGVETTERAGALSRLHEVVRFIENRAAPRADVAATIRRERALSSGWGGRTVFDDRSGKPPAPSSSRVTGNQQLELFDDRDNN